MDIKTLVETQRKYFLTLETKNIQNRIKTIQAIKQWMIKHQDEIMEALKKDLNKHETESYMAEIGLVLSEMNYQLKHIKKWSKNKSVWTPLAQFYGDSYETYEPYGRYTCDESMELSFHVIN